MGGSSASRSPTVHKTRGRKDAARTQELRISVVVPTYRRPAQLQQCLEGLAAQSRPANQIVVARRQDDEEARAVASDCADRFAQDRVAQAMVTGPGVVAALAAGIRHAAGEIIAFTDDDAVPRSDWLGRLEAHFALPDVGAVGGRDVLHQPAAPREQPAENVGQISWWGRMSGNHHLGAGAARDVMVLKGVNMAFRRTALALPYNLRGGGAQVHNELAMCLWARTHGWRVVYDPAIVVDHYPAPRFDAERRDRPDQGAVRDAAYNLVLALVTMLPDLAARRALYGLLVGDAGTPGFVRAALATVQGEWGIAARLGASLAGQIEALRDFVLDRRLHMVSCDS